VAAFVVVAKPAEGVSSDGLRNYCAHKLGKYKIPKVFYFLEELPKTHVGKIDKKSLKALGMKTNIAQN
jgi:fatty-acyl-CoA synthase